MKIFHMMMSAALAIAFVAPVWAQKEEPVDQKAEATIQAIADLGPAMRLAEYGRETKSAESLAVAGGMLLRIDHKFGGKTGKLEAKATDEKDNGFKDAEEAKVKSLKDQAADLFAEAKAIALENKDDVAALTKLVAKVSANATKNTEERGAVGGPKTMNMVLRSGNFHTFTINFERNNPGIVSIQSTGKCQIKVIGQGGAVLYDGRPTTSDSFKFRGRDHQVVTIKVANLGGPNVSYTLQTN